MRREIRGTFHLGGFEGVFRTLGNKDASGESPRLPPQKTAGVGGTGAGGAGKICDFRCPQMRGPEQNIALPGAAGSRHFDG